MVIDVISECITVGEQNSLGGHEESARMFKIKFFQMYCVFSKKKSSLKFPPYPLSPPVSEWNIYSFFVMSW